MRLILYDILPPLMPYLKLICTMDCDDEADNRHVRVLPDGCVELFINYTDAPVAIINNELYKQSILSVRMSCPVDVQMRKGSGCLAVCFHPGMAYRFFQVPMNTLADTNTSLSVIWGTLAAEVEETVAAAKSNELRVRLMQKYLVQRLSSTKDELMIRHCLNRVHSSAGSVPVAKLNVEIGVSQRHLSRLFQKYVGLSPKEYLRAAKFIQSLQHLKKYPESSLTEIAYESGYYDQAHFIRDFKGFSGNTPGEIVRASNILY